MVQLKAALAVVGAILLLWYWLADDVPLLRRWRRVRDGLLIAIGLVSCAAWWNLGRFHFSPFIHYYEFYHYYLGAKYAPELGYTRLYECTVAAEDEFAHLGPRLERAPIRDLTTNVLGSSAEALAHPRSVKSTSLPSAGKRSCATRTSSGARRRGTSGRRASRTTATTARRCGASLGGLIANRVDEMNDDSLRAPGVPRCDPAARHDGDDLVGVRLAHAVRDAALLRHQLPGRYWWTGGAYLRMDWLFAMIASICFMKKGKPFAVGVLHRLLDAVAHLPRLRRRGAGAARSWWRRCARRSCRSPRRRSAGSPAAPSRFCTLVPIATAYGGGVECWRGFVQQQRQAPADAADEQHGLAHRGRVQPLDARAGRSRLPADDPFFRWKQHQLDNFKRAQAGVPRRAHRISRAARDGRREARRLDRARARHRPHHLRGAADLLLLHRLARVRPLVAVLEVGRMGAGAGELL